MGCNKYWSVSVVDLVVKKPDNDLHFEEYPKQILAHTIRRFPTYLIWFTITTPFIEVSLCCV